jgi:hypothetical protein
MTTIRRIYGDQYAASYDMVQQLLNTGETLLNAKVFSAATVAYSRHNTWLLAAQAYLQTDSDSQTAAQIGAYVDQIVAKRNALAPVKDKSPLWEGIKAFGVSVSKQVRDAMQPDASTLLWGLGALGLLIVLTRS